MDDLMKAPNTVQTILIWYVNTIQSGQQTQDLCFTRQRGQLDSVRLGHFQGGVIVMNTEKLGVTFLEIRSLQMCYLLRILIYASANKLRQAREDASMHKGRGGSCRVYFRRS